MSGWDVAAVAIWVVWLVVAVPLLIDTARLMRRTKANLRRLDAILNGHDEAVKQR